MPRIYAGNVKHSFNQGVVEFTEGAAAVAANAQTGWFHDNHYAIDASKHALTEFDKLDVTALQAICDQVGIAHTPATDTKQSLVRAIETAVSTKYLTALTVTSIAGTEVGDSKITITDDVGTEGNTLEYKLADGTAPAAGLYKDILPTTGWTAFLSAADITAATGKKITVAEINAAREIISTGAGTITAKA